MKHYSSEQSIYLIVGLECLSIVKFLCARPLRFSDFFAVNLIELTMTTEYFSLR